MGNFPFQINMAIPDMHITRINIPTAVIDQQGDMNINHKQQTSNHIKFSTAANSAITIIDSSDSEEETEVRENRVSKISMEELQSQIKKQTVCLL